jgi:hypothetical protein
MGNETELTAWQEIEAVVPSRRASCPQVQGSYRAPVEVRRTDFTDVTPVDRAEFFAAVGPCLALTGGVGMSESDQRAWLEAAYVAIEGMPIGLLERGAKAALARADHPSKIIPAIMKEVGEAWERRKANAAARRPDPEVPALTKQDVSDDERKEVAKLVAQLAASLSDGPVPSPRGETREARA